MLKVVGASWVKTRISTYILGGAVMLAVGSLFFISMDSPIMSGSYCATVYWTHHAGFSVEFWGQQSNLTQVQKGVARTCYRDTTLKNGWSQIEIETQPEYPDWVQAWAAGMLEGALTWSNIHNQWQNTIEDYCDEDDASARFCVWLRETMLDNFKHTLARSKTGALDHYWYQIGLFLNQIEGLELGWKKGVERARADLELELVDFVLLNAAADLPDLRVYYENFVHNQPNGMEYHSNPVKASMLVQYLKDKDQSGDEFPRKVLIGHSSDGLYSSMLRMLKKYKFHFHYADSATNREVAGVDIAFTGYPGSLASCDDFYMISGQRSKLTVAGVRIQNANIDMWKMVDLKKSVLLAARVMSANRLAHSGYGWAHVISSNPGFGAKQWMVVDVGRMHNQTALRDTDTVLEKTVTMSGFENVRAIPIEVLTSRFRSKRAGAIWLIDQLPGRLHAEDMTEEIVYDKGYWTGNGRPFFDETFKASHNDRDESSSASSYHVGHANITDLESVAKVLKSRAYRGDLMGENASAYGNIDIKLYSETSMAATVFRAIAGPVFYRNNNTIPATTTTPSSSASSNDLDGNDDLTPSESSSHSSGAANNGEAPDDGIDVHGAYEIDLIMERRSVRDDIRAAALLKKNGPFRWSSSEDLMEVDHHGHPDVWNFEAVSPQWAWKHERTHING